MNLSDIPSAELAQQIIREFGLSDESPEVQAYLLSKLADNISGRVLFGVRQLLPEAERAAFDSLIQGDDKQTLMNIIARVVPNFDAFVQTEAEKEIALTKTYMLEESELAVTGGGQ